jgi:hypothetical protein
MTASQPLSTDPLAPATVIPTPAAASPTSAAAGPTPNEPLAKKKSSLGLIIGLAGVFLVMLLGAVAIALMSLNKTELPLATSNTPLLADPGNPPPPPQFTLATSATKSAASSEQSPSLEELQAMGKRLSTRLLTGAGETAAPRDFIVRGGSGGDGADLIVAHHLRWELAFPVGMTIENYTRQLDYFKIELGVLGGSPNVTYLSNLANPKPKTRSALGASDGRIYLIWARGPMREIDDIVVTRAGLDPAGKVLAHFIPPALEAEMLRVETASAQANKLTRIRKTVFGIQSVGADTFRLAVTEQIGD